MSVRTTVKSIQDILRQDVGVDGDAQRVSQLCWMFFLKIIDDQDQELEQMQDGYRSPIPSKLRWRAWAADPEGITGEALMDFVNDELFPTLKELTGAGKDGRRRVVRDVFEDAYNYMKSGQLMRQVVNKISAIDFNNLAARQHFGDIYEQILNDLQSAGNAGEYYTPRAVTGFMANRIDPKPGEILFDPACGTGGFLTCAIRHMRERYVKTPDDEQTMQQAYSMTKPIRIEHLQPCIDWWAKREESEVAWKIGIDQIKARTYNLDFKNPHTVEEDHGDPAELLAKLDESEAAAARLRDRLKAILAEALLR